MEFIPQGTLFDLMEKKQHVKFEEKEILKIFKEICSGVLTMHNLTPPVQHRDLKVENILFNGTSFKLCDFGSVSTESVDFS